VLALGIAYFVLSYVIAVIVGAIVTRVWGVRWQVELEPTILVFAVIGVVLSRLVGFAPGILIGVVIGLELIKATKRAELGAALLHFAAIFLAAVLAWFGYSALVAAGPADDFGSALINETLAAITSEGLTAAFVAALPLAFLEGRVLWAASKALWAGTFTIVAVAFAMLVLPTALDHTEAVDIAVWYVVLAVYGVVVLGAWFWFVRHQSASQGDELDEESVSHELGQDSRG